MTTSPRRGLGGSPTIIIHSPAMLSFTALNSPGGTEGSNSNSSSFFGSEDGISRHAKRDLMQDSVDDGDDDDNDDDDDDDIDDTKKFSAARKFSKN